MTNSLMRHSDALAEVITLKCDRDRIVGDKVRRLLEDLDSGLHRREVVRDKLKEILSLLNSDQFNIHARMCVDAMRDMQRRLETVQAASAPFDRDRYDNGPPKHGPCQGDGKGLGGGGCAG